MDLLARIEVDGVCLGGIRLSGVLRPKQVASVGAQTNLRAWAFRLGSSWSTGVSHARCKWLPATCSPYHTSIRARLATPDRSLLPVTSNILPTKTGVSRQSLRDCNRVKPSHGQEAFASASAVSPQLAYRLAAPPRTRKPSSRHTKAHKISRINELLPQKGFFRVVSCRALGPLSCPADGAPRKGRRWCRDWRGIASSHVAATWPPVAARQRDVRRVRGRA